MTAQEKLDQLSSEVATELSDVVKRFNDIRNREHINWADVGDMGRILEYLQTINGKEQ